MNRRSSINRSAAEWYLLHLLDLILLKVMDLRFFRSKNAMKPADTLIMIDLCEKIAICSDIYNELPGENLIRADSPGIPGFRPDQGYLTFDRKKQELKASDLGNDQESVDLRRRRESESLIIIFMLPLCDINRLRVHKLDHYANVKAGIGDVT